MKKFRAKIAGVSGASSAPGRGDGSRRGESGMAHHLDIRDQRGRSRGPSRRGTAGHRSSSSPDASRGRGAVPRQPMGRGRPIPGRAGAAAAAALSMPVYQVIDTTGQIVGGTRLVRSDATVDALPPEFFDDSYDPIAGTLKMLPDTLDQQFVENLLDFYNSVHNDVTMKLSEKVMNSYGEFVEGMTRVHELGKDLQTSTQLCQTGREHVQKANDFLSEKALVLLANYRRKQNIVQVIDNLESLKSLYRMDHQVDRALMNDDFVTAIHLLIECRTVAPSLTDFEAVGAFEKVRQERYKAVQTGLDRQLRRMCHRFEAAVWEKTFEAYRVLGHVRTMNSRIQHHFMAWISRAEHQVYSTCAENVEGNRFSKLELKDLKIRKIVEQLTPEVFPACVVQLLEQFCSLLFQHQLMKHWHLERIVDTSLPAKSAEQMQSIVDELDHFRHKLYNGMQQEISNLLVTANFAHFQVPAFLKILHAVDRFIEIGEEFAGTSSASLRSSIKKQSKSYFDSFHRERMEDMRTMLENETWLRCPVQEGWNLNHIEEMRYFLSFRARKKKVSTNTLGEGPHSVHDPVRSTPTAPSLISSAFYHDYLENRNPFSEELESELVEEPAVKGNAVPQKKADDDAQDEDNPELDASFIDEERRVRPSGRSGAPPPPHHITKARNVGSHVLTSATLNVVRHYGKYLNMMQTLSPLCGEIFSAMVQLFEFHFCSVFSFFGPSIAEMELMNGVSPELVRTFRDMRRRFESENIAIPDLQGTINIAEPFFGLSERTAAMESFCFIVHVFDTLHSSIIQLLPETSKSVMDSFVRLRRIVQDARMATYRYTVSLLLNADAWIHAISQVDWKGNFQHERGSGYLERIEKDMKTFQTKMIRSGITEGEQATLWLLAIEHLNDTLVEGFSHAKRCSDLGRGQMMMDFELLKQMTMQFTTVRPLPHADYVVNYIKGYYLEDDARFLEWIKQHREFSSKHLAGLVAVGMCGARKTKRQKAELFQKIEEIENERRRNQVLPL